MSRTIYTYTDLRTLGKCSFWKEISGYPQVCVSADLQKALKGTQEYDKVDGLFKDDRRVQACEMRKLAGSVLPKWNDDEAKFQEMVVLTQFMRGQIAKFGDDPAIRHWLVGCRRNLDMILSAIILLEEAGVDSTQLQAEGDRNVQLLIDAWDYLKQHNPAIRMFRKRMEEMQRRSSWETVFAELYGRSNVNTLVFHGFYYFTPIQERMLRALEAAGVQLVFLFCYNEKYPYANEIWRMTYSTQNGYPPIERWRMERSLQTEAAGEIFEGRKCRTQNHIQIKEYSSVMEFVHGMKHVKEQGYCVYSSNLNTANQILRDFYPEEYGERKLLSYPIGQFVSTLNELWDDDLQDIVLDEERLIECFASGWLAADGISGKQYMQDLVNILPFFADCKRKNEWEQRLDLLLQAKEDAVGAFDTEYNEDAYIARWQEIMGNPLLNFSVFAVKTEKLQIIVRLIRQLLSMAEELFGGEKTIRVHEHIRRLEQVLLCHEMSDELYEEERELVVDLFMKLSEPSEFEAECAPADISSALNLYMSGRLSDNEISKNKAGMVSALYQVPAACVTRHGKVHICMCDADNMPGGRKEYIWPLTSRHIKNCYEKTKNPLLVNMMHIMDSEYICNRYFMYAALKNPDVQLSWIGDMGDKLAAPSPYIKLVSETAGIALIPAKRKMITGKSVEALPAGTLRTLSYDFARMPQETPKEAKMDYAICPMKYALGYVVENAPAFQNAFHQNYAINGLIAAIHSLMPQMTVDEAYENVIELFPAMRRVEKHQVYDYLYEQNSFGDPDLVGRSELADVQYTDARLMVRFPNKGIRDQALGRYSRLMTPDGQRGMDFYKTAADEKTPSYKKTKLDVCLFCQHQQDCRYAEFPVDQEDLYD